MTNSFNLKNTVNSSMASERCAVDSLYINIFIVELFVKSLVVRFGLAAALNPLKGGMNDSNPGLRRTGAGSTHDSLRSAR